MKLTVLMDNNTFIDQYFLGEPALSVWLETEGAQVLFDAGYSAAFLENAEKLGVDWLQLTHVVLSHGHDDHTRGLPFLLDKGDFSRVPLVAHPDAFLPKRAAGAMIGMPLSMDEAGQQMALSCTTAPLWLTAHLCFLGEIPRLNDFEKPYAMGERWRDGAWEKDFISEDSALVYQTPQGLFVLSGCAHSGICNIVEYARTVCGEPRVLAVMGGFHLFLDDARLAATIDYFSALGLRALYPCHCVSLHAKARMIAAGLPVQEVGVGMMVDTSDF